MISPSLIKVAAALAAAHGQAGEAVFEHLLEAQELDDRSVHAGMQAQAALVGADGAVELDAVTAVHLHLAGVVHPGHAELDEALGLHDSLQHTVLFIFGVFFADDLQALQNLAHCLQELLLAGIALLHLGVHTGQILVFQHG